MTAGSSPRPSFTVVINTYNRAHSLGETLEGLTRQTYGDFEVVVVNGPSTDGTDELLQQWSGKVRVERCPEVHLCKSRNIGVSAAAGDVVAFIDDDAVPEPDWLEGLAAAYDDPGVAGAGGLVIDHTGIDFQYEFSVCSRTGEPRFDVKPPLDAYSYRWADPFVYLQGTNASFRRADLVAIGGFDEEIEYYLDEVEVCLQLTDRGRRIQAVDGAAVHHRYLPSHLRTSRRAWTNPYPAVKNRCYFALAHGTFERTQFEVITELVQWANEVMAAGTAALVALEEGDQAVDAFARAVRDGLRVGLERGLSPRRKSVVLPERDPSGFLRFPTLAPSSGRLRLAFVSGEYPPGDYGGIGRYTADLATGLAARGHEVHVVTRSVGDEPVDTVDIEGGVWVHRVGSELPWVPGLRGTPLEGNLQHSAAMYRELRRVHDRRPFDLVSAPIWNSEALMAVLDPNLPTVTTLMTTLEKVVEIHGSWSGRADIEALLALERATLRHSTHVHAISKAILAEVGDGTHARSWVLPLGVGEPGDAPSADATEEPGDAVRLLFVGRLERRKGADILLEALPSLIDEFPDLVVDIVGKDTPNTETDGTYREAFETRHAGNPELLRRVKFHGAVGQDELQARYRRCDVFVAPSRYESFGLVLLEAMSHGKPVVACDVGGMPEVVAEDGILVPPGDVDSLRAGIASLLTDAELRSTMGRRSLERFQAMFRLDAVCAMVESGYREMATSSSEAEPDGSLAADLAKVLVSAGSVTSALADDAANWLIAGEMPHDDPVRALAVAATGPTSEFIRTAFHAVLGRPATPEDVERFDQHLKGVGTRWGLPEELAASPESDLDPEAARRMAADAEELSLRLIEQRLSTAGKGGSRDFVEALFDAVLHRSPGGAEGDQLEQVVRSEGPVSAVVRVVASAEASSSGIDGESLLARLELFEEARADDLTEETMNEATTLKSRVRRVGGKMKRTALGQRLLQAVRWQIAPHDDANAAAVSGLMASTEALSHRLASLEGDVRSTVRMDGLEQRTSSLERRMSAVMDTHRGILDELHGSVNELGKRSAHVDKVLNDQWEHMHAQWDRIEVIRKELMLTVRYAGQGGLEASEKGVTSVEPAILDVGRVREARATSIRLNLGAGHVLVDGYLNVDSREMPGIDIVAEVGDLPFEHGEVAEISSAHLIEHFPTEELTRRILPYWFDLLEPGGTLRAITPDAGAMLAGFGDGTISFENLREVLYGGQEYDGDFHFSIFSVDTLTAMVEAAGFVDVEVVAEGRRNGMSLEFELVATKPGAGEG